MEFHTLTRTRSKVEIMEKVLEVMAKNNLNLDEILTITRDVVADIQEEIQKQ